MKLTSLRKALSVKHILTRYNRRYKTRFLERDLYVIYVIKNYEFPIHRLKILTLLEKTSHSINYKQLNRCLGLLLAQNLIQICRKSKLKKYFITPTGIDFLYTIENWTRRFRLDKVN